MELQWPPIDSNSSGKLCDRCAQLGLDTDYFHCELSDEDIREFRVLGHDDEAEGNQNLVAQDLISNLIKSSACPFCQLILHALEEQYQVRQQVVLSSHEYRLDWRYVNEDISRYAEKGNKYVKYIQVLSPANCNPDERHTRPWHFWRGIQTKSVRSLISPVTAQDLGSQFVTRKKLRSQNEFEMASQWTSCCCIRRKSVKPLVRPETIQDSRSQFLMGRKIGFQIDLEMVRKWISCCRTWHGDKCDEMTGQMKTSLPSSFFMVIDVEEMCLATPSVPCRYIALSYVWGANKENSFLALQSNIESLRAIGSLRNCWDLLPQTIQDSINLVKGIGERYLWIDSLCIVQDDPDSRDINIKSMDLVYLGAFFTIVAASGNSAIYGLPGMRPGSRKRPQRYRTVDDKNTFILADDIELQLEACPWVTRGWTFQEWVLTSRCLIFLDSQIVFSCRYATWREDIVGELEPLVSDLRRLNDVDFSYVGLGYELRPYRRFMLQRDLEGDLGDILMMTIREFLERRLTYDGDVLNAFQGILNDFALVTKSNTIMGTIVRILDWAVLVSLHSKRRRLEFSSWSWCGWVGTPAWLTDGDLFDWMYQESWIVWHYRGLDAKSIIKVEREHCAKWGGKKSSGEVVQTTDTDDWNELSFTLMVLWHTFKYKRSVDATPTDLSSNVPCHPNIAKNNGLLQFWTFSLPVTFSTNVSSNSEPHQAAIRYDLTFYDKDKVPCGEVDSLNDIVDTSSSKKYDVIVLSEANWIKGVELGYINHKDRKSKRDEARDIHDGRLNVMLIAWNGAVAERIGVGTVWKEVVHYLEEPGMTWKEVILC